MHEYIVAQNFSSLLASEKLIFMTDLLIAQMEQN
jgi:hypothetical protein